MISIDVPGGIADRARAGRPRRSRPRATVVAGLGSARAATSLVVGRDDGDVALAPRRPARPPGTGGSACPRAATHVELVCSRGGLAARSKPSSAQNATQSSTRVRRRPRARRAGASGHRRPVRFGPLDRAPHVRRAACANSGSSFVATWSRGCGSGTSSTSCTLVGDAGQHDDPVAQVDRLVDVVGDEQDRHVVAGGGPRSTRSSRSARVCASTDANGSSISRIDGW